MNAFEAYELYLAVKQHFTKPLYDFHKYNGKVNTTVSRFESREDKSFFFKIAKKYPRAKLIDLYVANFVDNPHLWIGDLLDDTSEEIYQDWQKRIEGLSYHFENQCDEFLMWTEVHGYKFNDLFKVEGSDHPIIVKMALQKVMSLETYLILESILGFSKKLDTKLDDIIWKDFYFKTQKYLPFISIDKEKCKQILIKKIETEYSNVK